ncbi:MAG: isochorismatase family protein, partial [Rhodanobacteraceae bacterium]
MMWSIGSDPAYTFDAAHTALMVIDMQHDFCSPGGYAHEIGVDIEQARAIIPTVSSVLRAARAARLQIVHTQQG